MCVWGFREQAFHGVHYPLDSEDRGSRTMQSDHNVYPFAAAPAFSWSRFKRICSACPA